jgi:hypothetical protein
MKKILFVTVLITAIACNSNSKEEYHLPGNFKYVAYRWNDTKDSIGLSLLHYLEIFKDGNYKLIQRNNTGNAQYYYGFIGNTTLDALINFVADSSFHIQYTNNAVSNDEPVYQFDFITQIGDKSITFKSTDAAKEIRNLQSKLDSVIHAPGKKQSSYFNIDAYLKKIIKKNTAGRIK